MPQAPSPAPSASSLQTAALDVARSVLMAVGTPLIAKGMISNDQMTAVVGGLLALGSAAWSYLAAHPGARPLLAQIQAIVRRGGEARAFDAGVTEVEAAGLPLVERAADQAIQARAGIMAAPLKSAANALLSSAARQAAAKLSV